MFKKVPLLLISAVFFAALSIGSVSAADQNYNVSLYTNTLTPEVVPIQFDASWNPANPLVYSATVHGILNTAAIKNNLNYTNANGVVNFADVTGWTIKKGNNLTDLNATVAANDVITLTKANEPTNYTITVVNTSMNPTTESYSFANFFDAVILNMIDGKNRIQPGETSDTFNITLSGTSNSSQSHEFVNVPLSSGLGALICGSLIGNYSYNISAGYMSVNGSDQWYVWLDDIDGISNNWSRTGTGWFLAKAPKNQTLSDFSNTSLVPTESLEKFTLNETEALNIFMAPSSLSGNGLPGGYNGLNISDNSSWPTYYYPSSSTYHLKVSMV